MIATEVPATVIVAERCAPVLAETVRDKVVLPVPVVLPVIQDGKPEMVQAQDAVVVIERGTFPPDAPIVALVGETE